MQEYFNEYAKRWIHKPDSFDKSGGLYMVHMGHNIAKPNYGTGPRQTGHYTLHFVREGRVQFQYGPNEVVLGKGDMFCKFPESFYSYRVAPGESRLKMIWFAFNGNQVPELMELSGFSLDNTYRRKVVDPDMETILHQMTQIPDNFGKKQLIQWNGLMYRIFGKLLPEQEPASFPHTPDFWLRKSLDFIHTCYSEKITVSDIATYIGIHRTHFSKTFTDKVGIPPIKYLQNVRLDKASQLLQNTSLSVTEIALSVGYPDLFTFTRAFTRQFHSPPSRSRNR